MPKVDFKPDVDGFAFKNDWTFNEDEKDDIRKVIILGLPVAAAALTPIIMAASPMIAPVAGLALGPVLPLVAAAGPFLFAAAPKIAEMIVNAITDEIAKGKLEGDLCGGVVAAALDYHRIGWLPPRGNELLVPPEFDANNEFSVESMLRKRIWQGQIESHLDDSPKVVLWKAAASVFGDCGQEWLRDRTREELNYIEAGLSAGQALPLSIVWKTKKKTIGHTVIVYALDWHGTDKCSITIYDNEKPDTEVIFDIDLTQSQAIIVDRSDSTRTCEGIFLAHFRQKTPPPAVVLSTSLSISPTTYIVHGEPLDANFSILNKGFGDLADGAGALKSTSIVISPPMAWQFPLNGVPPVPDMAPIAVGTDEPMSVSASNLPPGMHMLTPVIMAGSVDAGFRVARTLPHADGSTVGAIPLRVNPRIPIRNRRAHSVFGCARMLVEGERLELEADLSEVVARGIVWVRWSVTGALTMNEYGTVLVINQMPPSPGTCEIRVTVELSDGTQSRGSATVSSVPELIANRNQELCELSHILMRIPFARTHLDHLINPIRHGDVVIRKASLPDVKRVVVDLKRALEGFGKGKF